MTGEAAKERQRIDRASLAAFITEHLIGAADNTVTAETAVDPADVGTSLYDAPLVCVGAADDPLWERFKMKARNGVAGCCGKCQVSVPCSREIPAGAKQRSPRV
ncbi:MAG: hypothetical protein K5981_01305 [Clostridia bacterium]|nr:hypothetical protein [Clostridia bacterium]